jgi:histidine triad (HIT) family protein
MSMDSCIFCKIIEGQVPSHKVYEDEHVLAFAPLEKDILTKGHMLVIPKKHFENIYDITIDELTFLMRAVKLISKRLKEAIGADGINLLHASGKSGQQSSPHFHLHLAPRYKDDGLDTWPKTGFKDAEFPEVYKKMRELFME